MIMNKLVYLVLIAIDFTLKESKGKMIRDCTLGAEDFNSVVQSKCYVDKTLLIKTFMEAKDQERVFFVAAAEKFGKTVNLDMLKTFLDIPKDGAQQNLTVGCNLFKKYNLNIYKNNYTFFYEHCGQYPVIYFNFKFLGKHSDYNDCLDQFKKEVHKMFLQYEYLKLSRKLDKYDKRNLQLFLSKTRDSVLTYMELQVTFKVLSRWLYLHYGKKPIILFDDYDALYWQFMKSNLYREEEHDVNKFCNRLLKFTFKENDNFGRALITGCMRLSKEQIIFGEHFNLCPFLRQHSVVEFYGLTSREVQAKLNLFEINQRIEDVEHYYGGYKVLGSDVSIYNIWSVMSYLQTEVLDTPWVDPKGPEKLGRMVCNGTIRKLILQAVELGSIKLKNAKDIWYMKDIHRLREVMEKWYTRKKKKARIYMRFLLDSGYFFTSERKSNKVAILKIPNEERQRFFVYALNNNEYLATSYKFNPVKVLKFQKKLNSLGTSENATLSVITFWNCWKTVFDDNRMPHSETEFKGIIHNFLKENPQRFLHPKIEVLGTVKTKLVNDKEKGRVDILTVRRKDGAGIIIETWNNRGSAEEALDQLVNVTLPNYEMFDHKHYRETLTKNRVYVTLHLNRLGSGLSHFSTCVLIDTIKTKTRFCI